MFSGKVRLQYLQAIYRIVREQRTARNDFDIDGIRKTIYESESLHAKYKVRNSTKLSGSVIIATTTFTGNPLQNLYTPSKLQNTTSTSLVLQSYNLNLSPHIYTPTYTYITPSTYPKPPHPILTPSHPHPILLPLLFLLPILTLSLSYYNYTPIITILPLQPS